MPVSDALAGGEVEAAAAVATVLDGGVPPQAGTGADTADGHAEGVRGKNRERIHCNFCWIVCCFAGFFFRLLIFFLYVELVQILPLYQSLILLFWKRKCLLIVRICICKLEQSLYRLFFSFFFNLPSAGIRTNGRTVFF